MMSIRSRLFEQAERYVSLSIMSNAPLRDDVGEHKQLMRAALNREIDKTIELNRLHISRTLGQGGRVARRRQERPISRRRCRESRSNERAGAGRHPYRLPPLELAEFVARLFVAAGVPAEAAAAGRRRSGRSRSRRTVVARRDAGRHVYRAPAQRDRSRSATQAAIVSERQGAVVLDAGHALGQFTGAAGDGYRDRQGARVRRRHRHGPPRLSFRYGGPLRATCGRRPAASASPCAIRAP